jgi:D-amino-acid oxidase
MNGNVLLGGTYQAGNWDPSIDAETARGILRRCAALAPSLADPSRTRIIRHAVGFRPGRKGGPRVESEVVPLPVKSAFGLSRPDVPGGEGRSLKVVHAYGFA